MTEREWLSCTQLKPMFERVRRSGLASERKRLLFAVACLRRIEPILMYEGSREAVAVLERVADRLCCDEDRKAAILAAEAAADTARRDRENIADPWSKSTYAIVAVRDAAIAVHSSIEDSNPDFSCVYAAYYASLAHSGWHSGGYGGYAQLTEEKCQTALLRDLFGPLPFRILPPLDPMVRTWNDGTVPRLAETIYKERAFDRLPILADALEEAGCANADILHHCRQPGAHVRGCWVVDLILSKY